MRNLVTTTTGVRIGLAYVPAPRQDYGRDGLWLQRLLIDKPVHGLGLFERVRKFVEPSFKTGRQGPGITRSPLSWR